MVVDEKLLRKCTIAWGHDAQIDMAIEEMAELIFALQKLKRKRGKPRKDKIKDVQDEVADVLMTTQQMRLIFGAEEVDSIIVGKTLRLERRLILSKKGN